MVSHNSGFGAKAEITGQTLRLSISVLPVNGSTASTRFRDLPLTKLVGTHDERCAAIHESSSDMFGDIIASQVSNQAVSAVVAEFSRVGVAYVA